VEAPLAIADDDWYVYYNKGALAMYALRDAVGEARLNEALQRFLSRFALGEPPYPTTTDLLEEIRPILPEGSEHLVEDLFERITMFDNRIAAATSTERADGTFLVRIELEAHKRRGDGAGVEREVPIDDWIDVAVYGNEGDIEGGHSALFLERRRIRGSPVIVEMVVRQRPASVVIDPYYKLIDRDRNDNVSGVEDRGAAVPPANAARATARAPRDSR
jgi:ABC-2 type transport system permease protein